MRCSLITSDKDDFILMGKIASRIHYDIHYNPQSHDQAVAIAIEIEVLVKTIIFWLLEIFETIIYSIESSKYSGVRAHHKFWLKWSLHKL